MVRVRERERESKLVSFGCNNYHLRISNDFHNVSRIFAVVVVVAELIVTVEHH